MTLIEAYKKDPNARLRKPTFVDGYWIQLDTEFFNSAVQVIDSSGNRSYLPERWFLAEDWEIVKTPRRMSVWDWRKHDGVEFQVGFLEYKWLNGGLMIKNEGSRDTWTVSIQRIQESFLELIAEEVL